MSSKSEDDDLDSLVESRLYKQRWVIIFTFSFYLSSNAYQWLHLNIIGDVIIKYYNTSMPEHTFKKNTALDWLSLIYMLTYVVLIIPSMWFLQKKGLRVSTLCGSFLNAAGAWIKVASVSKERFPVLLFGQTVCAIAQVFTLSLAARIAAVWFGPNEVSTATAICVFGIQTGVAIGFMMPPILVPFSEYIEEIGHNLSVMFYVGAGVTTFCFILLLIAINLGCSYAISTLLNPVVLYYFKGHQKDTGFIGLAMILSGTVGSVLSGIWLDRTKTFKGTTIGIYAVSLIGMIIYTFILRLHLLWVVYLCAGFLGFFLTGYRPVGFQFAVEVTYPESEAISSGLLNMASEIIGVVSTMGMRALITNVSILAANLTVCSALFLGTVLSAFIGANYKRQTAGQEMQSEIEIEIGLDETLKMTNV